MWNFNTLKIHNFKTSRMFYRIKIGYNVHDVLSKVVFYITLISTFKN